jgi:hypothetical protein
MVNVGSMELTRNYKERAVRPPPRTLGRAS